MQIKTEMFLQVFTCHVISVSLPNNDDKTVETIVILRFAQSCLNICYYLIIGFFNPEKKLLF